MVQFVFAVCAPLRVFLRARGDTALEMLALRQQLAVLKRKRPRPALHAYDRLFWTTLRRIWWRWADVLLIVKPETVVGMAPCGLSPLLALAIQSARWPAEDLPGTPGLIPRLAKENPE